MEKLTNLIYQLRYGHHWFIYVALAFMIISWLCNLFVCMYDFKDNDTLNTMGLFSVRLVLISFVYTFLAIAKLIISCDTLLIMIICADIVTNVIMFGIRGVDIFED